MSVCVCVCVCVCVRTPQVSSPSNPVRQLAAQTAAALAAAQPANASAMLEALLYRVEVSGNRYSHSLSHPVTLDCCHIDTPKHSDTKPLRLPTFPVFARALLQR